METGVVYIITITSSTIFYSIKTSILKIILRKEIIMVVIGYCEKTHNQFCFVYIKHWIFNKKYRITYIPYTRTVNVKNETLCIGNDFICKWDVLVNNSNHNIDDWVCPFLILCIWKIMNRILYFIPVAIEGTARNTRNNANVTIKF